MKLILKNIKTQLKNDENFYTQQKSLIKRDNIITMAISTALNKIKLQAYQ